jgi:hypothetical protein
MDLDSELPNNISSKKTQVAYIEPKQDAELPSKITDSINTQTCGLCHNKSEPDFFADQPIINEEIDHPITATDSGLWQPSKTEVSATTMMNQNAHLLLTSSQTTHSRSASPQSFKSTRVPFSKIFSFGELSSMVNSLAVKLQVSSTPKVSCHTFALLAFEPIIQQNKSVQPKQH